MGVPFRSLEILGMWNSRSSNTVVGWTSNEDRSMVLNKLLRDAFAFHEIEWQWQRGSLQETASARVGSWALYARARARVFHPCCYTRDVKKRKGRT